MALKLGRLAKLGDRRIALCERHLIEGPVDGAVAQAAQEGALLKTSAVSVALNRGASRLAGFGFAQHICGRDAGEDLDADPVG